MLDRQVKALCRRVRKTLRSGRVLAVIGWMDRNHDKFTRELEEKKIVRFFLQPPPELGESIGYAIFTRFVDHADFGRLKQASNGRVHPIVLQIGQIKEVFRSCGTIAMPPLHSAAPVVAPAVAGARKEIRDDVMDFLTTQREEKEMSSMEKFMEAFLKEANGEGVVGMRKVAELRREFHIKETPPQLVRAGILISEAKENKSKTGWYRAGPRMEEFSKQEKQEPTDSYELAKFLVAQEPELLAQKAEIEQKLARIATAKEALKVLESLKKPETSE